MKTRCIITFLSVFLLIAVFSASALAGWTVTYLHPAGYTESGALGISGGQLAGSLTGPTTSNNIHAGIYSRTAGSWVDVTPAGSPAGVIKSTSGTNQAGSAYFDGQWHAGLWNGTAASFVDLHPTGGYFRSAAEAVSGNQQVGSVSVQVTDVSFKSYAALWTGTAGSFVNLNPLGCTSSNAFGVLNGKQVGEANGRAGYWTGNAETWTDINPASCVGSNLRGLSADQEVGEAFAEAWGYKRHAALWSGTAESYVNLHPSLAWPESTAYRVSGGWQVGAVCNPGEIYQSHASLWNGTAESWVDLHSLLSPDYSRSEAMDIEVVGDELWIAGWVLSSSDNSEAVMWHYEPVPEPSSLLILGSGVLALAGFVRRKR
ncbi:MAG TPA: PEP-CTERM sorting domain-containing protein [Armatimonadota bacterium]|nr:PEP-CTERM sorting domain-containing protein [Armatimonadota bacterium]